MKATTTFDEITVFGARGTTLVTLDGLEALWQGRVRVRAFIDDFDNGFMHPERGIPVISSADRLRDHADLPVLLTITDSAARASVATRLKAEGATFATATGAGQVHVDPSAQYGAGSLITPYTRIGPQVRFGEGAFVQATVFAHDVDIGAYSNILFNASVMGHVVIGNGVSIGPHAIIANGTRDKPLRIGDGAVVGIGAVVVRDVPPGARVGGNPAMPLERWKQLNRLLDAQ